jgi:hypothetical protein
MTAKKVTYAVLAGLATLLASFVLTIVLYILWADWRYPGANSMAGLSAMVLAFEVAPISALVVGAIVLCWPIRKPDDSN